MKKYLKLKYLLYAIIIVFAFKGINYYQEVAIEVTPLLNDLGALQNLLYVLPLIILPVFIYIFSLIIKLIFKLFAKNRNFNALKFSKQIIIYLIIFPLIIFFSFIGLVSTKINEKPIYEIVITYYNNTFNNEEKPNNSSKGKGKETSKKAYRQGYSDGQTGYGLPASSSASAYEFYMAKRYNYSEADYKVYVMGYNDGLYGKTKKY